MSEIYTFSDIFCPFFGPWPNVMALRAISDNFTDFLGISGPEGPPKACQAQRTPKTSKLVVFDLKIGGFRPQNWWFYYRGRLPVADYPYPHTPWPTTRTHIPVAD